MDNIGVKEYRQISTRICEFCPVAKKGPRELCQYCEYGSPKEYPVRLQVEPRMRSPVFQVPTGTIDRILINGQKAFGLYDSPQYTTIKVPAGSYFDVEVGYVGQESGGWSTCATMIATDGTLPNYDITWEWTGGASGLMKLDENGKPGPMPNKAITLRIKLWGHPDYGQTTPPSQSKW